MSAFQLPSPPTTPTSSTQADYHVAMDLQDASSPFSSSSSTTSPVPSRREQQPHRTPTPYPFPTGRRTPDRTFHAPNITWATYRPLSTPSERCESAPSNTEHSPPRLLSHLSLSTRSAVSSPPTPQLPGCTSPSLLDGASSIEVYETGTGIAQPVRVVPALSVRTVSLSRSDEVDMLPLETCRSRWSRFTEHLDLDGEAMYACCVSAGGSEAGGDVSGSEVYKADSVAGSSSLLEGGRLDSGVGVVEGDGLIEEDGDYVEEEKGEREEDRGEKRKNKGWKGSLRKKAKWLVCCGIGR